MRTSDLGPSLGISTLSACHSCCSLCLHARKKLAKHIILHKLILILHFLQIVARARVGARLSTIYALNKTGSVWSHSDADGMFYVVTVDSSTYGVSVTNVTVSLPQSFCLSAFHVNLQTRIVTDYEDGQNKVFGISSPAALIRELQRGFAALLMPTKSFSILLKCGICALRR